MRAFKNLIRAALALSALAQHQIIVLGQLDSDTSLTTVSRVFEPSTIEGLNLHKAAEALTPSQCAGSTILHRAIKQCSKTKKSMFIIPHAAMEHDGEQCGTGGSNNRSEYMIVVPGEQLSDPRTAVINGLAPLYGVLSSNARAINAFNVLRGLDPIHVGFEYSGDRTCGGKVAYGQKTIFFFLTPSPGGQDLNFGFAYLAVSEVGMVSVKEDEQLCLYKQSRDLGPGQAPFATPTPSVTPGRNTDLPATLFDLDDPAELDPCFPVTEISAPKPSQNASDGSPTPKPSRSVEPTTSITPTSSPTKTTVPIASTQPPVEGSPEQTEIPSSTEKPAGSPGSTSSPSPSRSSIPDSNNDPACFPSSAKVQLSSGSLLPIAHLRVGDQVLTGQGKFSDVFLFTHHTDKAYSKFVRLRMSSNITLNVSPGHYIPVSGRLKTAQSLRIGDILTLGNGKTDVIVSRTNVVMKGLHNPQTLDGEIVVDGVIVSTFTQAVDPSVAMPLLVPVKFLYCINFVTYAFGIAFSHGNAFLAALLPSGSTSW